MNLTDIIGYLAAFFSTASFVPQVWKTLRTRDTSSISLLMYSLFLAGVAFWLAWSLMARQWPAVVANSLTLCLAAVVFALKLRAVVLHQEKA